MKIHFSVSKIKNKLRTNWASKGKQLRTEPHQDCTGSYKKNTKKKKKTGVYIDLHSLLHFTNGEGGSKGSLESA